MVDRLSGDVTQGAPVLPPGDWNRPISRDNDSDARAWGVQPIVNNLRLLEDTFSAMDEAVLLLSGEGRVVYASALARSLLANQRGLCVKHEKLCHPSAAVADQLSKVVVTTLHARCRSKMTVSLAWGETLSLDMTPADPCIFPSDEPLVFVRMRRNSAGKPADADNLITTFDVTKAEARVLAGLVAGLAPCELAAQNRVSEHTVRSHIANLKSKMNCSRIVDLVKLAVLAQN